MLKATLLGTGGMMPLPERALASAMLEANGRRLLIDCGEGTQVRIRACGLGFKAIDGILITHFHGDHVIGLPGLLLSMANSGREAPLTIAGPTGLRHVVECLRVVAPELPFDIDYREIDPDAPEGLAPCACGYARDGDRRLVLRAAQTPLPGGSYAATLRFEVYRGAHGVVSMPVTLTHPAPWPFGDWVRRVDARVIRTRMTEALGIRQ